MTIFVGRDETGTVSSLPISLPTYSFGYLTAFPLGVTPSSIVDVQLVALNIANLFFFRSDF